MIGFGEVGFCHEHALILYVYLGSEEDGVDDSVLTVGVCISTPCLVEFLTGI